MAKTVEQIERDLAALEEAIAALKEEFEQVYQSYLAELGKTARQQLVMASYHLCTRGYPESFLSLSVSQREALQRSLRQVSQSTEARLIGVLEESDSSNSAEADDAALDAVASESAGLILSRDEAAELESALRAKFGLSADQQSFNAIVIGEDEAFQLDAADDADLDSSEDEIRAIGSNFMSSADSSAADALLEAAATALSEAAAAHAERSADPSRPLNPLEQLTHWQARLERRIAAALRDQSQAANRLLHQAEVLPNQIPEPILEVAAKASSAEASGSLPNLLNLMIEAKGEESNEVSITRIMAIRLRLAELEFGSPLLASWRSKVRGLNARLKQLGKDYDKKTRQRAIAQAEQAWRATWSED